MLITANRVDFVLTVKLVGISKKRVGGSFVDEPVNRLRWTVRVRSLANNGTGQVNTKLVASRGLVTDCGRQPIGILGTATQLEFHQPPNRLHKVVPLKAVHALKSCFGDCGNELDGLYATTDRMLRRTLHARKASGAAAAVASSGWTILRARYSKAISRVRPQRSAWGLKLLRVGRAP